MDSTQLLRKLCNPNEPDTPDCISILDALLLSQERIDELWQTFLRHLPEASPAEAMDEVLAVDQELHRYRRAMIFLRANLGERSAGTQSAFFIDSRDASG
jgi:hypothetical protein